MNRTILTAFAVALFAAPVAANTFDLGDAPLSVSQEAQVANVLNSDESTNTKQRLIDAIVAGSQGGNAKEAQVFFILGSDESTNTKDRLVDAILN